MITVKKAIQELSDAVTASGKSLEQIGKVPVFEYLRQAGINQDSFNDIWNKLVELHTKPIVTAVGSKVDWGTGLSGKSGNMGTSGPVGVSQNNPVPQEKQRVPRKSVFGEIKKIAG